jgi:S1-C subfamily serine protease
MRRTRSAASLGLLFGALMLGAIAVAVAAPPAERVRERRPTALDDRTFRPTVVVRKGAAQGSGTVIASANGETIVLTAAHVVDDPGPLRVELHRYNLGVERQETRGRWPRSLAAEVIAADEAADVALLRFRRTPSLPYVARLAPAAAEPAPGTVVTSVGIDLGAHLGGWTTRVARLERLEVEGTGAEGLFLITPRFPEHGRSGGGLFLPNGDLVGVCVGRAHLSTGKRSGLFASCTSIHRLLHDHDLEALLAGPPARR